MLFDVLFYVLFDVLFGFVYQLPDLKVVILETPGQIFNVLLIFDRKNKDLKNIQKILDTLP